jgi:tetratricopeptide (TPR) repeat protein
VKPRLALSMIVRDAGRDLARCLASVRDVVDEMVLADTGSMDDTIAIARSAGARVIQIPWENDFARARNRALAEVDADWVLVLDADEMLDSRATATIAPLLRASRFAGYIVPIRNYFRSRNTRLWDRAAVPNDGLLPESREYPAFVAHGNVRLFHRDPEIYYTGRVHESVGPRIIALGRPMRQCNLVIHHFGLAKNAEEIARKNELYRELGREKIREMPENAQAHFELGLVEFDNFHNDEEALKCLVRACELNPKLAVAWQFRALTLVRLKRPEEAMVSLEKCNSLGYATALVSETRGDALYNLGKFAEASSAYEQARRKTPENVSVESKFGLALLRAGEAEKGIGLLRSAIEKQPECYDLHDRLIQAFVWLGQLSEASAAAASKLEKSAVLATEDYLRAAGIRAQLGDWERATEVLREGCAKFPASEKLRAALGETESAQEMQFTAARSPVTDCAKVHDDKP